MLRRILITVALLAAAGTAWIGVQFYRFLRTETVTVDDRLYVILGGGGNTSILIGDDGVLVVDTKFWRPGRTLPERIRAITDKPVKLIINTHYHADHTHGNPNYAKGTTVMAQRRTRQRLITLDKRFWEVEPAWSLLPSDLIDDTRELQFGDETVRIIHPGRGHTDGDVIVHFVTRGIVAMGDLYFNGRHPRIDLRGGGSAREWVTTLDRVLAIDGVTRYVPGHGPLADRAGLMRFQRYLQSLVAQVEDQVRSGRTLAEIKRSVDLHAYDDWESMPFLTSPARNVASVYEEVTGRKK
jgi:glyoxylase-like metal-dependent hydrolase (beta-lactamase superfamily II)